MEAQAFERALRAFARRTPFRAFVIEFVSGTRLHIEHPEALVFRGGAAVHIDKDNEFTLFDHQSVSNITSVTDATATA
jgi:hypothetical protein